MLIRVLVVADDPAIVEHLRNALTAENVSVGSREIEAFWEHPGAESFDLALVAQGGLPNDVQAALDSVRRLPGNPEIAVLSTSDEARRSLALQAAGFLAIVPATIADPQLRQALNRIIVRRRELLAAKSRASQAPPDVRADDFVSKSPATQRVLTMAKRVAASDTSLLLIGETGVGKDYLARAVHNESPRAQGPFVAINCGAIPESLLESELFGYEKGAFTGASRAKRGYFELAHRGTLFLDEIGEMPAHLQVRLLRVLQERTVQRLGSEESVEVDLRVIAATNQDLRAAIKSGSFREDLYYRLAVVSMTVPSLRDRREDIEELAQTYLLQFAARFARHEIKGFTPAAEEAFASYAWPGNVRELINVIERAVLLCEGNEIDLGDLPDEIAAPGATKGASTSSTDDVEPWLEHPLEVGRLAVIETFERQYLHHMLTLTRGSIGETARRSGLDPRTLYNKMRQLGLRKESYRKAD